MKFSLEDILFFTCLVFILSKLSFLALFITAITVLIFALLIKWLNRRQSVKIKKEIEEKRLQRKHSIPIIPECIKSEFVPASDLWLEFKNGQYHLRAYHSATIDRERDPETYDRWLNQLIELHTQNGTLPR